MSSPPVEQFLTAETGSLGRFMVHGLELGLTKTTTSGSMLERWSEVPLKGERERETIYVYVYFIYIYMYIYIYIYR